MSSITPKLESLGALTAFVHVAETGGFAAAARRTGQSPSAVAKAVARLEVNLGVDLFTRTTRTVTLTDEGSILLDHARRVLDEVTSAESAMAGTSVTPTGRLKVSVPVAFGENVVVPALPGFLAANPNLSVELHLEDRMVAIAEEGFDAAVRIAPALADSALVARTLGPHNVRVYGAPEYFSARGTPRRPTELQDHDCIGFTPPGSVSCLPWMFVVDGKPVAHIPNGRLAFNGNSAMLLCARAGLGVAALPDYVAAEAVAEGRLTEALAEFSTENGKISILWPAAKHQSPKLRSFVDHLSATVRSSK